MRIEILRHGACADQAWLRGHTDSKLDETGMATMGSQLHAFPPPQKVISSDLQRCCAFAKQHFPQVRLDSVWRERDYGVFDGLEYAKVAAEFPQPLADYLEYPFTYTPDSAETFLQFQNRIQQAWSELISHSSDSILLITHGGPMRLILQSVLHIPNEHLFHIQLGYASRISIEVTQTDQGPFCQLVGIHQAEPL